MRHALWKQMKSGNRSPVNFRRGSPKTHLSARKLAARLWQLRFSEASSFPKSKPHGNTHSRKPLGERKLIGDSVLVSELLGAETNLKAQHQLEDFKDQLARERRSRERMESLNAKLLHDLAQAKLYANQCMLNYEEEKRKRQVIERVCNELAMQIEEDRAKLEGLQRHSMRIQEQMEEERKVFHMLEMWREESIQMKLLDAKLALEDKYNQMIQLIAHLQSFLRSRGGDQSLNVEPIAEVSRDFTMSNDVFSVEPYYPSNFNIGPSSTVHIVAQQNSEDPTFVKSSGNASTFMFKGSCESGFRQWALLGQRNFADSVNPHITRGMKGCIEWPRGIPKINSKVIPLEERVRKQKSQLQHILKPLA